MAWWVAVLGISEEVGVGFCGGKRKCRGDFRDGFGCGMGGCIAGILDEIGG